jgi:putative membrane protein
MKNIKSVLVICADRDNDLGRKAGIQGPVIGRKSMLNAAARLAIADPEESDANCMFAAVKKLEEIKDQFDASEVACLTGFDKSDFRSDREILNQFETVLEKFPADGIVLVTDGAEDDQVIPILQSRLPIISKQQIVIKQAREVESTFYTIKEALKDPFVARIVFGVPGLILLLYFLVGSLSLQIISFVLGLYLLLKGFGLEEALFKTMEDFKTNLSFQRVSFLFFIGSLFFIIFAVITAYNTFVSTFDTDPLTNAIQAIQGTFILLFLAGESLVLGRIIDFLQLKKAFRIPEQIVIAVSIFLLWFVLDAGTEVFLKKAALNDFLFAMLLSLAALFLVYRFVKFIDVRKKVTQLLIGLPVYSSDGKWLGRVEKVYKEKELVEFKDHKSKETKQVTKGRFRLSEGKIVVSG